MVQTYLTLVAKREITDWHANSRHSVYVSFSNSRNLPKCVEYLACCHSGDKKLNRSVFYFMLLLSVRTENEAGHYVIMKLMSLCPSKFSQTFCILSFFLLLFFLLLPSPNSPTRARATPLLRLLDHTQWHTTCCRILHSCWNPITKHKSNSAQVIILSCVQKFVVYISV